MDRKMTSRALIGLLAISILLSISVITGVGLETRDLSVFPSWQASMFMYGGPVMIIISLAAIGTVASRPKIGLPLAVISAGLSLLFSVVGIGQFGAPDAPMGVVVADVIHIVVAVGVIGFSAMAWRQQPKTANSPATAKA